MSLKPLKMIPTVIRARANDSSNEIWLGNTARTRRSVMANTAREKIDYTRTKPDLRIGQRVDQFEKRKP